MICINPNSIEFKQILAEVGDPLYAEVEYAKRYGAEQIKPGVSELFESNPELANAVYEALGIYNVWHASDKKIDKFISENVEGYFAKVKKGSPKAVFFTADKAPQESFLSKREYQEQFAVKMNNPLVVDTKTGYSRDNESFKELVDRALAGNHDGVIVKNVDDNGFVGDVYISLNANQISKITPQQKQQALQLYSQYLDTIFPDSKVKDIVYHGTKGYNKITGEELPKFEKFDKSFIGKGQGLRSDDMAKGFYFGSYKIADRVGTRIIPAILNVQEENNTTVRRATEDFDTKGDVFVVFEPEQIHILGTKQDIEGFKEFVSKNINERFAEQAPTQFDRDRLKAINELNDMVRNFRVDEILAEKGYDVQDFISNLETANNQDELNKIINKILQLLC